MIDQYLSWPKQIRESIERWSNYSVPGDYDEVFIAGMGGSGIVGEYIQVLSMQRGQIPVYVLKSHLVPVFVDKKSLFIVVSYSGNTIESLIALKKALSRGARVVAVSSGGLLREEALKQGFLHVPVPSGLLPRSSLASMLYTLLGLLDTSGYTIISQSEAYDSADFLEEEIPGIRNESEKIANWLYTELSMGRLPIVTTHSPLETLAIRFKNEFNENSKIIVKVDVAPEWMHNDIVGYEAPVPSQFSILEIIDPENRVGAKLVEFMRRIYTQHTVSIYRVALRGSNLLEKLMYGSIIAGIASVLLAEKRGFNPAETRFIALYKKEAPGIFGE